MKKRENLELCTATALLFAFLLWTVLLRFVDVGAIGPNGSSVGFSTLNGFVMEVVGVNFTLYTVTDWLCLVPIAVAFAFAVCGLVQLVRQKNFFKVDRGILQLGVFYVVVIFFYLLFENVVINYRPVLINGVLEVSYPSSTTLLVLTVMPTMATELCGFFKDKKYKYLINFITLSFCAFMLFSRIVSGVHWISDIIGGSLLSLGLDIFYAFLVKKRKKREQFTKK